jgi:hypothetical protein
MKRVSLSLKGARAILAFCSGYESAPLAELDNAVAHATRPRPALRAAKQRREVKKKTKREETSELRAIVAKRAEGACEHCGIHLGPFELDHMWGRGKEKQTFENCWLLCRSCHHAKTNSIPERAYWLEKFVIHCLKHGFSADGKRAADGLEALRLMDRAAT